MASYSHVKCTPILSSLARISTLALLTLSLFRYPHCPIVLVQVATVRSILNVQDLPKQPSQQVLKDFSRVPQLHNSDDPEVNKLVCALSQTCTHGRGNQRNTEN